MTIEDRDIAIIGMAGKVPGADNVSEFWANLCAGRDGLRALSDDELRRVGVRDDVLADARYVKVAAPLNGVDRFDPAFFRISPQEAELMDPQIRLLLQCAWETLEDAGYAGKGPQRIGVFAGAGGVTTSYFANFVNLHERFEKTTAGAVQLGNDKDFLATCISYRLNLTGPSMTVQTACSTSLVAVHQARMSVLNGECEMALAGGVSVRVPHEHGYHYREGYIFSRSGRVRPFDAQADGIVFGSGLGLVLLKRLADAVRDGDAIHAVIKGSALGNDGKGKMSYAASSAKGQVACIRAALDNAGVDAGSIGFVEAHGTGTAMGDPEEVKALSAAFRADTDRTGYCVLGAVKANVGHLEAAAGIVGLIKAVLVLKHGVIPPALHYATPNPRIRFEATPFRIDAAPTSWQTGKALRRAGVNSLGVGGTNAFVVLEQYARGRARRSRAQPSGQGQPGQPVAVPLSARTQASLHAYAARLAAFLERDERNERGGGTELELADIAYTLQTGRDAMACRAVFVVASIDALHAALRAYVERGEIAIGDGEAGALASAWMAGDAIDWLARYRGTRPRRVNLPTYVFASERCWIDAAPLPVPRTLLHPLLHANTSDLHELRYSSLFCGSECFLKDHQLCTPDDGQDTDAVRSILPGAAYLEMARAAFERAGHPHGDECVVVLGDVVWVRPIEVEAPTQVDIALLAEHDGVAFEVFGADQTVHCQGHARWREAPRATASSGPRRAGRDGTRRVSTRRSRRWGCATARRTGPFARYGSMAVKHVRSSCCRLRRKTARRTSRCIRACWTARCKRPRRCSSILPIRHASQLCRLRWTPCMCCMRCPLVLRSSTCMRALPRRSARTRTLRKSISIYTTATASYASNCAGSRPARSTVRRALRCWHPKCGNRRPRALWVPDTRWPARRFVMLCCAGCRPSNRSNSAN